jgi:hypothetical protein
MEKEAFFISHDSFSLKLKIAFEDSSPALDKTRKFCLRRTWARFYRAADITDNPAPFERFWRQCPQKTEQECF